MIPPHLLALYGMVIIIAVHMIHSSQCCMKSGPMTQRFGQEDSRKLTSTISSHCLSVSKNIWMVRPPLKLPEMPSDMNFTLRVLHNFPVEPEAQVLQL